MRYLKLLLFLCTLPLLAEEAAPPATQSEQKNHQEEKSSDPATQSEENTHQEKEMAQIPLKQEADPVDILQTTESYETAFIKTIVVLVGLLALILLTIWMFKKISNGRLHSFNSLKSVRILEKRPLSPKSMLYLIEVGGKQVLLAESQIEVRPITTLDWLSTENDL